MLFSWSDLFSGFMKFQNCVDVNMSISSLSPDRATEDPLAGRAVFDKTNMKKKSRKNPWWCPLWNRCVGRRNLKESEEKAKVPFTLKQVLVDVMRRWGGRSRNKKPGFQTLRVDWRMSQTSRKCMLKPHWTSSAPEWSPLKRVMWSWDHLLETACEYLLHTNTHDECH